MNGAIEVRLGERSYGIHVGRDMFYRSGALLKPFARGAVAVVTDDVVAGLHLDRFVAALRGADIDARPIVVKAGEASKSFAELERLADAILEMGVERAGLVVALGGGVVGDLAGLAAAIVKRGVALAQIPTTLLAQVDSAIGGKTAINTRQGKNLIGLVRQPRIVIADTSVLATLPRRELLSGYAEVVKYGALCDAAFFDWLEARGANALDGDVEAVERMVSHSCFLKAGFVSRDEHETGERALLNLGHTFGHALEAVAGYSGRLVHGEAVAIGMALAFRLSARLGLCPAEDGERLIRHLRSVGLPAAIADMPGGRPEPETLIAHMRHDKKAKGGAINFILLRGMGRAFITADVPPDALLSVLTQ